MAASFQSAREERIERVYCCVWRQPGENTAVDAVPVRREFVLC